MLYMATGKPAHLGCKFLSDVSVVNSPIVVELLVITFLFCVVLHYRARKRLTLVPFFELRQPIPHPSCLIFFFTIRFNAKVTATSPVCHESGFR